MVFHREPVRPFWCMAYFIKSDKALSKAFVMSRKTIYRGFLLLRCSLATSFRTSRWSVVAIFSFPPACASEITVY